MKIDGFDRLVRPSHTISNVLMQVQSIIATVTRQGLDPFPSAFPRMCGNNLFSLVTCTSLAPLWPKAMKGYE